MPQVKIDIYDEGGAYHGSLDVHNHEDFPLAISQSITDMRDITKRSGVSSKSFKVLATANNNRVFKYIYNANVDATDTVYGKRARVMVNGLPALEATIRIKDVVQQIQPQEYELELIGDNLDWVYQLKEMKISELDYGRRGYNGFVDTYYHAATSRAAAPVLQQFNLENIEATWYNSYANGFDYVYSLKDY